MDTATLVSGIRGSEVGRTLGAKQQTSVAAVLVAMLVPSVAFGGSAVRTLTPSSKDLPPGISAEVFSSELRAAAATWSYPQVACTSVELHVTEPEARRLTLKDGVSLVVFRPRAWCHNEKCGHETTFPIRAAAMTTTYPEDANDNVPEADIEMNGVFYGWQPEEIRSGAAATVESARASKLSSAPLRAVLVHEIGHVLGFDDACAHSGSTEEGRAEHCSRSVPLTVMNEAARLETPSADDVRSLCARFPRVRDEQATAAEDQQRTERPGRGPAARWLDWLACLGAAFALLARSWRAHRDDQPRRIVSEPGDLHALEGAPGRSCALRRVNERRAEIAALNS